MSCFWFLIIGSFLSVIGLTVLIIFTSSRLEDAIGPPTSNLSLSNRVQLSIRLAGAVEKLDSPISIQQNPTLLTITSGGTPNEICADLTTITDLDQCSLFIDYLVYKGLDREILAGVFSIPNGIDIISLAGLITDADKVMVQFNLLPGWRVEEIAESLALSGILNDPQGFIDLVHQDRLEGFLFPTSYNLPRNSSAHDLEKIFSAEFQDTVPSEVLTGFDNQGLSTYQAVTLASIVQREAIHEDEMPLIASVYLNRLRLPMKLDADPTVQYALGFDGSWWKSPLSFDDYQVDSPYNTYLFQGLPPAPIANPGLQALYAVAFPEASAYLFFRNACDNSGYHTFSLDYNEHLQKECP